MTDTFPARPHTLSGTRLFNTAPGSGETERAAAELAEALQAAGITAVPIPRADADTTIELDDLDADSADRLTRVIRRGMRPALNAATALQHAFAAHNLDMPTPHIHAGSIHLGDIGLPTADALTRLLGGTPPSTEDHRTKGWEAGQQSAERLHATAKRATRGGFLDTVFHADCLRCHTDARIELGPIRVGTARRLATALHGPGVLAQTPPGRK